MTIFAHPDDYRCATRSAVSDLEERIRIRGKGMSNSFRAVSPWKTLAEAPEEYRRRSPAWNAASATPLLIHTTTNDEDVNIAELQKLIAACRPHGRISTIEFIPRSGGHLFNRLDTKTASESRQEIWLFWLDTFILNRLLQKIDASRIWDQPTKGGIRTCVRTTGVPLGVLGTSTNCATSAFSRGLGIEKTKPIK